MAQQESYDPISNRFKTPPGPSWGSAEAFASKYFLGKEPLPYLVVSVCVPFKFSPIWGYPKKAFTRWQGSAFCNVVWAKPKPSTFLKLMSKTKMYALGGGSTSKIWGMLNSNKCPKYRGLLARASSCLWSRRQAIPEPSSHQPAQTVWKVGPKPWIQGKDSSPPQSKLTSQQPPGK